MGQRSRADSLGIQQALVDVFPHGDRHHVAWRHSGSVFSLGLSESIGEARTLVDPDRGGYGRSDPDNVEMQFLRRHHSDLGKVGATARQGAGAKTENQPSGKPEWGNLNRWKHRGTLRSKDGFA